MNLGKRLMETWKPVVGYEGWYEVSNLGRVKRIKGGIGAKVGHILKPQINSKWGYKVLSLSKKGQVKLNRVARLVAQAFIPNPENKPQVNHKDGIKTYDYVENLEWNTRSENIQHRCKVLGINMGEKSWKAKFNNKEVLRIKELLKQGIPQRRLAEDFGVCQRTISCINRGITYKDVTRPGMQKQLKEMGRE